MYVNGGYKEGNIEVILDKWIVCASVKVKDKKSFCSDNFILCNAMKFFMLNLDQDVFNHFPAPGN